MTESSATAHWSGTIEAGQGKMKPRDSEAGLFGMGTRFGEGDGTNPEQYLGAALAGCFSMALSKALTDANLPPRFIRTSADVHLHKSERGFEIPSIALHTHGQVPNATPEQFESIAEKAKSQCPIGMALSGVDIAVDAQLERDTQLEPI